MTRNNYTNSIGWDTIGRNKYGRDYWGGGGCWLKGNFWTVIVRPVAI